MIFQKDLLDRGTRDGFDLIHQEVIFLWFKSI